MKFTDLGLDHSRDPRNVGAFPPETPGVGRGSSGSVAEGMLIRIEARVQGGRIAEARFKAFGCPASIASASLLTEWARDRTPADAASIHPGDLAEALGLEPERRRSAEAATAALREAITNMGRNAGGAPTRPESSEK